MWTSIRLKEIPISTINGVSYVDGFSSEIVITCGGKNTVIGSVPPTEVKHVSRLISDLIKSKHYATPKESRSFNDDTISKIERLGELKQKGLISESEFEEQKAKLLTQM